MMRLILTLGLAVTASAQLSASKIVEMIAPNAATPCPTGNSDCRTADQAAPYLVSAMQQYGIYHPNQIAAAISLMAFESGDFRYKHNIYPGRAGQGTANMQMPPYNLQYAKSLDGVKDKVSDISSTDGLSDDQLNQILALVTVDEYNFGSGPWYLKTICGEDVQDALVQDADSGFQAYMGCVGTPVTDDRQAYFTRAKQAFGIQ